MRPNGSPAQLEKRRLHAIALLNKGYAPVEVAERLGVDRRSVRRWKASFRKKGEKGVIARPAPGRPLKLDSGGRKKLERLLLRGAMKAGYSTDLWTCARIADLIKKEFGIKYHVDHIGRLLRSLGWSPQKPERRARERDEKKIKRWIKVEWPKIKKKPGA
jgi:transposase